MKEEKVDHSLTTGRLGIYRKIGIADFDFQD